MKKIYFILGLLILSLQTSFTFAINKIPCSREIQVYIDQIQKLPEAVKLIEKIQEKGDISIAVDNQPLAKQFGAFYDADRRTIHVHLTSRHFDGEVIGSLIFELHNALINPELDRLDNLASTGQIDKNSYVEAVEKLEYENSLKASKIASKGIQLGLFPKSAQLMTYSSFEEHLHYQKIGGHSAWIAHTYDQLSPKPKKRFSSR